MAQDDDRSNLQPQRPPFGATTPPDHVNKPHVFETFHDSKPEDRDGTLLTTAGTEGQKGGQRRPTITDGVKSIQKDDFMKVHQIPCARESFLTGIGAGFVVGTGRYVLGARIPKAANWAAGSFMLGSILQWEFCRWQRDQERVAMARAVEVIDKKKAEKQQKAEEAARLKSEAAEKARQEATTKKWFKFWQR